MHNLPIGRVVGRVIKRRSCWYKPTEVAIWYYRGLHQQSDPLVRKARYAIDLLVIPLTGIDFATQVGQHSVQYLVTVYRILTEIFVLTGGTAYVDQLVNE